MMEVVAFQENPTKRIPTSNAGMPREGMFRTGIPMDSKTRMNPTALRL